jgi:hypothetical protein
MGSCSLWRFRTNFTLAIHRCSLPRRRVTKQFICHPVRVKSKPELLATSSGAPELLVASFS